VSPEMVEQIIESEGGAEAESTYDGRKLSWTRDSKRALWTIQDGYKRRRSKARIEKAARLRRLDTVSLEFARAMIEEETGAPLVLPAEGAEVAPVETAVGKKLIARDEKRNPLFSELEWTADAAERILRVPAGFMRNRTQQRIEDLARERAQATIDLSLVEEGIEQGRKLMEEMIQGYRKDPAPAREAVMPERPAGELPLNEVGIMAVMEARRLGDAGK